MKSNKCKTQGNIGRRHIVEDIIEEAERIFYKNIIKTTKITHINELLSISINHFLTFAEQFLALLS